MGKIQSETNLQTRAISAQIVAQFSDDQPLQLQNAALSVAFFIDFQVPRQTLNIYMKWNLIWNDYKVVGNQNVSSKIVNLVLFV